MVENKKYSTEEKRAGITIYEYKTDVVFTLVVCIAAFIIGVLIATLCWQIYMNNYNGIIKSDKVNKIISSYYGEEKPDKEELENIYIQSVIDYMGDKYTYYVSGDKAEQIDNNLSGKLCGIGVRVSGHPEGIQIVRVMENSPAEESGLYKGMIITEVDGNTVDISDYSKFVEMIAGEEGTTVRLTVKDEGKDNVRAYTIKRKIIDVENAYYSNLGDAGYIRIETFSEGVSEQFRKCLAKDNSKNGIIIDLRGNTGGVLKEAEYIADILMDDVVMITTIENNGKEDTIYLKDGNKFDKPIVILVDGMTASASEVLAGSLRDNVGAKIVGTKTYGKGIICDYVRYNDGSIVSVSSGEYILPKGESIDKVGILPDYIIEFKNSNNESVYMMEPEEDNQLNKAIQVLSSCYTESYK